MLTLQLINQDPEDVIRRLAVKHFDGREPIMRIVELDKQRRALQKQRDDNAAVLNKMAAQIGALMKQGNREEAESVKGQVAGLKTANKEIDDNLSMPVVSLSSTSSKKLSMISRAAAAAVGLVTPDVLPPSSPSVYSFAQWNNSFGNFKYALSRVNFALFTRLNWFGAE